jgi:hypothetical protein
MTIDELIAAHWGDCDIQHAETPEAYAIRHEEARLMCCWDLGTHGMSVSWVRFADGRIEILSTRPDEFSRTEGAQ